MAVVYQSDGGTVWAAANNNTAVTVPLPATRPVGSVLLCFISHRLITGSVTTAPSGFTLVSGPHTSATASGGRVWVYAKEVVGGESAPTVACDGTTGTSGDLWGAVIACYAGVDTSGGISNILDATTTVQDASGTTTCTYPAITTASPCAMVVRFMRRIRDAADTFTPTAIHDEREDFSSIDRTGGQHHLQDRQGGPAGSKAAVTVAPSNTTAARYLAISLALKTPSSYATYVVGTHNPSLYWALDGVSGAIDLSGNGRHGTAGGGVTIGGFAGGPGLADESNTSTDFVTDDKVTSSYNPYVAGTTRTFLGHTLRDTDTVGATLWAASTNSPNGRLGTATNDFIFDPDNATAGGTNTITGGWTPGNGVWGQWGFIFREAADTSSLYIDGAHVNTGAQTQAYNAAPGNFQIGCRDASTNPLDGKMAHVAVFEGELSAADLLAIYEAGLPPAPTNWTQPVNDTMSVVDAVAKAPKKALADGATITDLATPLHTTNIVARYFDDVDDYIETSIGACATTTGAFTMAVLARIHATGEVNYFIWRWDETLTSRVALETSTTGLVQLRTSNTIRAANTAALVPSDGWGIIVASKAAGTVTPRLHVYKGGAWTHEDSPGGTSIDTTGPQTSINFGRLPPSTFSDIDLAVAGQWPVVLSDAQVEELSANAETQDWMGNSGGAPEGLWEFNQASTGTAVTDLTSNGANQSAIVGTTVINTGPSGWTYGVTAPPLTWSVPDTFAITDAVAKAPKHPVADTATWVDGVSKRPGKQPADTATWSDASARKPGKAVADTGALADAVAKAPKKPIADGITVGDTITHFWAAVQSVMDSGTWADVVKKSPGKRVSDTGTWADNVNQVLAVLHTKAVPDALTIVDALTKKPGKRPADAIAITDAFVKTVRKTVADAGTWGDNWSFGGGLTKQVADTLTITDALLKAPKHPVADTATWADAVSKRPGKRPADTAAWADAVSKRPGKVIAETPTIADSVAFASGLTLLIEDTLTIWDDVILPALDAGLRVARLFMLTAGLVSRETDAQVAYNSAATTPLRSSALDTPAYETALEALSYESGATAGAYETGIIVVETDLEIT